MITNPKDMLRILIDLHESVAQGGRGITPEDWVEAKNCLMPQEPDTSPPPPLKEGHKANFDTLKRAAANDDLALVSVRYADGTPAAVIGAIDGSWRLTPLATMIADNPYEMFQDPTR
jgi:hypothetical protein